MKPKAPELPPRQRQETPDAAQVPLSAHFRVNTQTLRSKGSESWILFLTRSGRGFFRGQESGIHVTGAGELCVLQPRLYANYGTLGSKAWDFDWVHFHPAPAWAALLKLAHASSVPGLRTQALAPARARLALEAFERLHAELRRRELDLARNSVERILLLAQDSGAAGTKAVDERVERALDMINADFYKSPSVAQLASLAGLSPSRFSHLFKSETGSSVHAMILRAKLEEAAKLLRYSGATVSQAAYGAGFSTASGFSNQFRKHFGMSPKAYRSSP